MVESAYEDIWVVPSTKELKGAQLAFGQSARGMKYLRSSKGVAKDFDYVLIEQNLKLTFFFKVHYVHRNGTLSQVSLTR